jgi:hypothetical protein
MVKGKPKVYCFQGSEDFHHLFCLLVGEGFRRSCQQKGQAGIKAFVLVGEMLEGSLKGRDGHLMQH